MPGVRRRKPARRLWGKPPAKRTYAYGKTKKENEQHLLLQNGYWLEPAVGNLRDSSGGILQLMQYCVSLASLGPCRPDGSYTHRGNAPGGAAPAPRSFIHSLMRLLPGLGPLVHSLVPCLVGWSLGPSSSPPSSPTQESKTSSISCFKTGQGWSPP